MNDLPAPWKDQVYASRVLHSHHLPFLPIQNVIRSQHLHARLYSRSHRTSDGSQGEELQPAESILALSSFGVNPYNYRFLPTFLYRRAP